MVPVVTSAKALDPYILEVAFSDGTRGKVNVRPMLWGPVFEPVLDPATFSHAHVDPVLGTVVWPGGADISPVWLYDNCAHEVLLEN